MIWIRSEPDLPNYISWSLPNNLLAVVMHEIGHALGVGHIPGTVMDEALSNWIREANQYKKPKLIEEIDIRYELVSTGDTRAENQLCRKMSYTGLQHESLDTRFGIEYSLD